MPEIQACKKEPFIGGIHHKITQSDFWLSAGAQLKRWDATSDFCPHKFFWMELMCVSPLSTQTQHSPSTDPFTPRSHAARCSSTWLQLPQLCFDVFCSPRFIQRLLWFLMGTLALEIHRCGWPSGVIANAFCSISKRHQRPFFWEARRLGCILCTEAGFDGIKRELGWRR